MKHLVLFVFFLSTSVTLFAQNYRIEGNVLHAENREKLEFINVILQTTDSAFIKGTTTDIQGRFLLEDIPSGDYLLAVSGLGYETTTLPATIRANRNVGEILLNEKAVDLEGVTVAASNMTSSSDRKVVFPTERQVKASTNGVSLLQQLMLPKIQVNPLFNEISLPGGGEVQLRINGVKVELQDIVALIPSDIIKIEYHDNPGLRYGNAEVVLDYIVRRPETGGSFSLSLNDAFKVGMWGNNNFSGRINHKKSEFSVNYYRNHRKFKEMWRDNEELFTFAGGSTLHRKEQGILGLAKMRWEGLTTSYSYQDDKQMLNASFRYHRTNNPNLDYQGVLYNITDPADRVEMIDRTAEKYDLPSLDLYYQRNLPKDQTLVLNVVGTYHKTANDRIYRESRGGTILTDVNNSVEGEKYSIIGEGIYEKKFGQNRLGAGLRHTQAYSDNDYRNGNNYSTEMDQSSTFLYTEFRGKLKKLDYTVAVGMNRSYYSQDNFTDEDYTFNPRIVLHYTLPGRSFIRLRTDINNSNPSLSNMSAIEQTIDSLQIQRGNPLLKPYQRYRTELTYELQKGIFYANLFGIYEYAPDAIMEEKQLEGNKIVQTWDNQQSWKRLSGQATLRVGPIKDILQLSATGGVNRYLSKGNEYYHDYTNWFIRAYATATYKKFMMSVGLETNWNWFYGETLSGGENIHYIMLQYTHKNLAVGVGAFNPFINNYKVDQENWSKHASHKKSSYINESSRMFMAQISYSFSFGRKFNTAQKRLDNSDTESGVMSTGK